MPSIIDQIRRQQAWDEPKKASLWPLILAAFLVGVGGAYGWNTFKTPSAATSSQSASLSSGTTSAQPERQAGISTADDGPRLGRAESAPLLKTCVQRGKLGTIGNNMLTPEDLYRIVQQSSQMLQIAAVTGAKPKSAQGGMAFLWADLADCIYRQNGWVLCDPNNRALAVEAANTLSRQVAAASSETFGSSDAQYAMSNARAVKDRVLAALRSRVEEGRLIASDFGFFAHGDIRRVVDDVTPNENACARRS